MLDYSMNEEEQKNFIKSYKVKKGFIYPKLAKGKAEPISYSEAEKEELEKKMKNQVNALIQMINMDDSAEVKKNITRIISKRNRLEFLKISGKIFAFMLSGLFFIYIFNLFAVHSIILALIFDSFAIITFGVGLKFFKKDIINFGYSEDIQKNYFLSEFKEELREKYENDPKIKKIISKSLIKTLEKTPNKDRFNLGNADEISISDFNALQIYFLPKNFESTQEKSEESSFTRKRKL